MLQKEVPHTLKNEKSFENSILYIGKNAHLIVMTGNFNQQQMKMPTSSQILLNAFCAT